MNVADTIDIILCTYNRAHLIKNAILSVRAQTYSQWRLLIIDDGSTDQTAEVIKQFQSEDIRIEYYKIKHSGLSRARNAGIQKAAARFVTFIDSDDEYNPDHLMLRVEYFVQHPDIDLVHGGVKLIGEKEDFYVVDVFDEKKLIHIQDCCVGSTLFGKLEVFKSLQGFKIVAYSAESDFLERAQKRYNIAKVAFPTYRYNLMQGDRICKRIARKLADG